jgi:hypothetical protein
MSSRFLALRVRPANHHIPRDEDGALPEVWLLADWPTDADKPTDYWLSTLPPGYRPGRAGPARETPLAHRTRLPGTETGHHFEGRSWLAGITTPPSSAPPTCSSPPSGSPTQSGWTGLTLYSVLREANAHFRLDRHLPTLPPPVPHLTKYY